MHFSGWLFFYSRCSTIYSTIYLICSIIPAVERPGCESVCLFPSAPAVSAADGVLLSACSSHPADRTKTPPACGPQPVSLRHCWIHLGDINKKNLIIFCHLSTHIPIMTQIKRSFELPLTCYYSYSTLQCLHVCVILMNYKYALKALLHAM